MYQSNMAALRAGKQTIQLQIKCDGHARLMVKRTRNDGTADYKHCRVYKKVLFIIQ